MLLDLIQGGFQKETLIMVLLSIPVIMFSLSFHEFSHGLAAKCMGDPTAYNLGRLTLNPAKHLDPMGTLMMLIVGFGWAKPVPINTRHFKNPKWGMCLSALAGPVSNLLLSYICFVVANVINVYAGRFVSLENETSYFIVLALFLFFTVAFQLNIYLAVFNLLPVPPLDGSRIMFVLLPAKAYFGVMKYERYISLAIMILLFTGILSTPLSMLAGLIEKLFAMSLFWMV
ncbi:MAG: site-2 protease family protein [Ruminococcaceae bacterium]|nr:site-2 protease family protein [Oscillospiraceae bacterium]